MQGPIAANILLILQPYFIKNIITLSIIPLKALIQHEWIAAIIFAFWSHNRIGAQSAVKIAIGNFFWLVMTASTLGLFFWNL